MISASQIPELVAAADPDVLDDPVDERLLDEEDTTEEDLRYEIASYGADYDVEGLVRRLQKGDVKVPEFQRGYVWPLKQASRFIESLLLGLPVPGIFLSTEPSTNKLLVIDGQQRLSTLRAFYDGIFPSSKKEFSLVDVQTSFEGKTYKTLSEDDRRVVDNAIIHATVIKQTDPKDGGSSIYKIFERLNSSGMLLSPQEIRTAIYGGPLAETLSALNKVESWRALFGPVNKRMRDQELILRFLTLYLEGKNYKKPIKTFLNKFMETHRNLPEKDREELTSIFTKCTDAINTFVGAKAFKPSASFNAALFDALMVGTALRLKAGPITDGPSMQASLASLLEDKEFFQWISQSTSDDEVVKGRIARATDAIAKVL
ncbi:MAG: DUF262 domain-containing protein [Acidobacteriaceae bacterium]|jgi:hypothetical protein